MKMVRIVNLVLLVMCVGGLAGCVVWTRSQPPALTVISQTPIKQEHVDALHGFEEYDILLVDAQTLRLSPASYRILDSYYDALRIAEGVGAQPLAVYDAVQVARALTMRLQVLLLLICFAVEIMLGRYLWRYTKGAVRAVCKGLMQYYPRDFMRQERKTLTINAFVLLGGLTVMGVLWRLCVFEPVWAPQSTGSVLSDMWGAAFRPVAAGSILERVNIAAAILFAAGIVLTVSGLVVGMIGWRSYEDSTD